MKSIFFQCSFYPHCLKSQSENFASVQDFVSKYGTPGNTYSCLYNPNNHAQVSSQSVNMADLYSDIHFFCKFPSCSFVHIIGTIHILNMKIKSKVVFQLAFTIKEIILSILLMNDRVFGWFWFIAGDPGSSI